MSIPTDHSRAPRPGPGSILTALAALVVLSGAALLAAEEEPVRPAAEPTVQIPPIDADAPAKFETASFGLG